MRARQAACPGIVCGLGRRPARKVDFALGSDTGGSARPAASGIYGPRPRRAHRARRRRRWRRFDVPGWFAATPGVFRKVGPVLLDDRRVAAKIDRVMVLEDAFAQAEEPVADLLRTLLELMSDDLPEMMHGKIAPDGFDPWREAFRIVQAYETWQTWRIGHYAPPKIGLGRTLNLPPPSPRRRPMLPVAYRSRREPGRSRSPARFCC
jgi:amidase